MHVNVCIIYFRASSCSLIFTLYQSYWIISVQVLKKPPILAVTLLPFKSAFRITLFGGSFQMHLLPLTKASWFVCAIFSTGKHNYGQQNNHDTENAVCSLAVAMRMQVSVTSNVVHFLCTFPVSCKNCFQNLNFLISVLLNWKSYLPSILIATRDQLK